MIKAKGFTFQQVVFTHFRTTNRTYGDPTRAGSKSNMSALTRRATNTNAVMNNIIEGIREIRKKLLS